MNERLSSKLPPSRIQGPTSIQPSAMSGETNMNMHKKYIQKTQAKIELRKSACKIRSCSKQKVFTCRLVSLNTNVNRKMQNG